MAQFDIDGARAAGYDDDEIADFLGARLNFDTARARESGYSGSEIIDFLRSRLTPADADPNIDVRDVQARTGTASALETANLDEAAPGIYPGGLRRREPKPEQPAKPEGPRGVLDTVDLAEPFTPADERAFGRPQPPMGRVTALPEKTPSEQLGERVGEATGSKGAGALARGVAQGEADIAGQMWGVIEAFSDATGLSGPADFARQARRAAEGFATGVDARSSRDPANQFLQTGARGFTANVPALTLTAATGGGVPTSLGLFGVQSFGSQYGEGRDAGLDPGPAFLRAAALTIPEVASELLPTERLLRMGGAAMQGELQRTLRAAVQAMLTDIPGEQLNQIAAFLIDKAPATGLNPNATPEELRQQLAETLYHTIAQGVMFAGAGAGLALARRPSPTVPGEEPPMPDAAEMVDRVFRARADRAAAAQARENAQRAQEVATILDAQTVDEVLDAAQAAMSRPSEVEIEPPPPAAAPVATAPATAPTTPQAVPDTLPHTPDAELLARVPEEPAAPPPAGPATVDVEAAAAATSPTSEHPEPTEAQKEAGNYRKGHVRISGLDISIENPAGSKRRPEWPTLRSHYGYIRRTEGADGDHVDVFVRPGTPDDYAGPVFVVDQVKENGEFDEHKVMLGFDTLEAARAAYLENYTPDWQGLGAITALDMPAFVEWTRSGDTTKPLGDISAMSNAVKQANASAKAAPEKPAEGESGVVKWTKAKIIPTRQGVKAVPEPAPAPAAAPGAPSATLSRKAGWDFERTFPEPRFDELDRAGGLSTFDESRDADDLADTVADWHRQFIEELGRRAEAFRTLDHAVRTGKNPQTGKPLKKRDAMRDELREERNNQRRLLRGLIEEYGAEFGDDAAAALAKHAKLTDVLDAPDLPPVAPEVEPEPTPAPAPAPAPAPVPAPAPAPTPSPGAPPITEIVSRGAAAQRRPQVSPNKVFTEEAAERARALLRKKLGQVSAGIDPEIMQAGITLAGYHIERGARTFAAYARAMIEDLGDIVRPYLKSWYLAVKYDPRAAAFADEMDDAATVERATVEGGEEAAAPVPTPTPAPAPAHAERAPQFSKPIEFTAQTPAGEVRVEASRAARVPDERHTYVNFRLHGDMVDETGSRLFYSYAIKGDPTADEVRAVGEELANRAVMQYAETWWKGLGKRDREALIEVTGLSLKPGVQWRFIPAEDRRRLLEASAGEPTMAAEAPADVDAQPTRPEAGDGPADRGDGTDRDADRGSVGGRLAGAREGTREERPADRGADEAGRDGEGRARARDEQQPPGEARDLGDVRGRPAAADVAETPADHSITDADRIGEGGLKSKYRDNVAAIRLLKELEREGKRATYDQQRVLARYVGWGGLKGVFDPNNKQWAKEYAELKELLTPDEYERARRTILDAHYTSPEVIKGIYGIMRRLGFTGGRVLEPSIGAGHFIGLMPSDMRAQSAFTGVELDRITGLIAQHLYPTQNIIAGQGFQEVTLLENSFDAAVGNPPFGDQTITDLTMPQLRGLSIHNFFFAKSIHAVRPGGLMVMVVSRYFMDARDARARRILAKQAKLLGAVRLPRTAFRSNANTEVVTDVLVFQKYASGETRDENPDWLKVDDREIVDGDARGTYAVNTYFSQNPDHILGRESPTGTMYARNEYTVVPGDESIADGLRRIAEKLPANVYEGTGVAVQDRITDADGIIPPGVRPGNLFVTPTGHVALRGPDIEGKPTHREFEDLKDMAVRRIKGLIEVRDALRALMRAELTDSADDAALDQMRAELNKAYDKFVKKFGYINRISNRRAFVDDVDLPLLESLEPNYDAGISPTVAKKRGVPPRAPSAEKAPIFSKRVLRPFVEPTSAATAKEALLQSMNMRGHVDMAYMSALYGKPEEAIAAELEGLIFRDPSQGWVTADEYLSGNVKAKLEQARAAAKDDPTFEPNVKALEAVQPAPIAPEEISVRLGSPWVPGEDILAFAKEMFGPNTRGVIQYMPAVARWTVSLTDTDAAAATSTYGTQDVPADDLLEALLNNKKVEVRRNIGTRSDPVYVVDEAATLAAQAKAKELGQAFRDWIWNSAERRERLAKLYNDKFNANVDRKYDGSHLSLPGKSPGVNLRPHQKNVIWRALQDREILLDHVVGAGKTFAMVGIAMEARRLGILRKPMFVVPNHLVGQWRDEFYRLYPNANILAATEKDFEKANRERLFARIVTGDWDAVIVAHSSLKKIGMPPAVEQEILGEMSRDVSAAIQELKERRGDRNVIRDMERIKVRLDEKMKRLNARSGKRDKAVSFDELGVDGLFVDEAHLFKNLYYFSQMQNVSGLGNPAGSARAFDLFVKVRYLQSQRGTKGMVAFATGTPVSNSLVEMFTMQRYMMYDEMRARGMHLLDAWAGIFGDIEQVYEVHPSGSGYRLATRFSQFVNMPELMQLYRSFADVITMRDLRKQAADRGERFPVPNVAGGKPRVVVAPRSDLQRRFFGVAEFERDENGRIRFEADPGTLIVQRGADLGKKGEAADKLYVTTNDPQHQAVRGGPFETEEQAREEIERLIRTPKVRWNENSILWKYDHLRELTKDTKGKINALSITNEARKAGLDYRLIDPNAPDFPDSKVNKAVAEIVRIYRKWDADKGTQLVFCDLSVPQSARDKLLAKVREQAAKEQEDSFTEDTAEEPAEVDEAAPAEEEEAAVSVDQIEALKSRFSVYDDVKSKLIAAGIPENQIAFIHDYDTSAKKLELYERVRRGEVRVLMGSTEKMGAGMNVQSKLVALHHLDAPWRPSDLEQREGRIIRQGNEFYARDPDGFEVEILRYATEQTYDTRMWQLIEHKANGVEQLRNFEGTARKITDVSGEAANAAEMKAAASGNPLILEEIKLRNTVQALEAERSEFQKSRATLENALRSRRSQIEVEKKDIAEGEKLIAYGEANPSGPITVNGTAYEKPADAAQQIVDAFTRAVKESAAVEAAKYRGLTIYLEGQVQGPSKIVRAYGESKDAGVLSFGAYGPNDKFSATGLVQRVDNLFARQPTLIKDARNRIAEHERQIEKIGEELKRTWPKQEKLAAERRRHHEITQKLARAGGAVQMTEDMRAELREALKARGLELIGEAKQDVLPYGPDGEPEPGPIFYSELLRQVEGINAKAMTPGDWEVRIRSLKGVKRDEIEWSGVIDWLKTQTGRLTKEDVVAFLRENGVQVQEVVRGGPAVMTDEISRLIVELDAAGYTVERDDDGAFTMVRRRADDVYWEWTGERFFLVDESDADPMPDEIEAKLLRLVELLDTEREQREEEALPKYAAYQLPGGENYTELLLTLPVGKPTQTGLAARKAVFDRYRPEIDALRRKLEESGGQSDLLQQLNELEQQRDREADAVYRLPEDRRRFMSGHWNEPNIVAHVRFNERKAADGKRVLFIEEIQSDWAQRGRERGFAEDEPRWPVPGLRLERYQGFDADRFPWMVRVGQRAVVGRTEQEAIDNAIYMLQSESGLPRAPFVEKTEQWVSLALKRMIRWAAEHGFDRIAWTTGRQQTDRYDLRERIEKLRVLRAKDGRYYVRVKPVGKQERELFGGRTENELIDLLGKNFGQRVLNDAASAPAGEEWTSPVYEAADIEIGGDGMLQFYDRILPNIANDVLKKLGGGRVGKVSMLLSDKRIAGDVREQPGFDITPAMRQRAMVGLPLFQPGIDYGLYQGGGDAGVQVSEGEPARRIGAGVQPARGGGRADRGDTYVFSTRVARDVGGSKPRPRILAKAIADEFRTAGVSYLNGKVVRGPDDVAALAQVWRDPRYETFRIIFTRNGRIVHATAVSSRMPGRTVAFASNLKTREQIREHLWSTMRSSDADGYYLLHNHPSGDPSPSHADIALTFEIADNVPGFKGHVIINSGRYAVLEGKELRKRVMPLPNSVVDEVLKPALPSAVLGRAISNQNDVAAVGKLIQRPDWIGVIMQSGSYGVRVLAEMPPQLLDDYRKAAAWIRRMATQAGGGQQTFLALPEVPLGARREALRRLQADGFIIDAVANGGMWSLVATGSDPVDMNLPYGRAGKPVREMVEQDTSKYDIEAPHFDIPAETRLDAFNRYISDNLARLKATQDSIREQGGDVEEFGPRDVYRAAERFPGIVTDRIDRFVREEVEPLFKAMDEAGITPDELALFAYAKHAPERNEYIASINERFAEGAGSGMSDEDAAAVIEQAEADGKLGDLEDLHQRLLGITAGTRQLLADEGLISPEEAASWATQYENYVPLRGFEHEIVDGRARRGTGQGFSIRGRESIAAMGRRSRAGQIIENILLDRERAVLRAEKNRVGKALLDLVTANPDDSLWQVNATRQKPRLRTVDGISEVVYETRADEGDHVFSVKVGGREVRISLHDPLLATAMKNLTDAQVGPILGFMQRFNSMLSRLYTGLNPVFVVLNGFRDYVAAMIQAQQYEVDGKNVGPQLAAKTTKHYRGALAAAMRFEYGKQRGTEWDRWFAEYSAHGGRTGYMALKSLEEKVGEVQRLYRRFDPNAPLTRKSWAHVMRLVEAIEGINQSVENATRAAAYRAGRELGMSPAQAASVAKNITVNFNRRGELTRWIAPFFLFWNASVQGTATFLRAMRHGRVQAAAGMLTAAGIVMSLANIAIGGDDDDEIAYWDKIPDYEKERNLIIMLPPGDYRLDGVSEVGKNGRYVKIPLPYGYNPFVVFGNSVVDALRNMKDGAAGKKPMRAATNVVSAVLGSYNPAGGDLPMTSFAPVAQPAIQWYFNVNRFGDPLYPEPQRGRKTARAAQFFDYQRGSAFQVTADALNRMTGGNSVRDGLLSIQPGVLENTFRYFTGGLGQSAADALSPLFELHEIGQVRGTRLPFYRQLYGEVGTRESRRMFQEVRREAQAVADEIKALYEANEPFKITDETALMMRLAKMNDRWNKALSRLRKEELAVREDKALSVDERRVRLNRIEFERRYLYNAFLATWKRGMQQVEARGE